MTRAGRKRDLRARCGLGIPVGQRQDVLARDIAAVFVAQQVLEEDLQGVGQAVYVALLDSVEAKIS